MNNKLMNNNSNKTEETKLPITTHDALVGSK